MNEEINNTFPLELLFFSWMRYGHYPKGRNARLVNANDHSFTIETSDNKNVKSTNEYNFVKEGEEKKVGDVKQRVVDAIHNNLLNIRLAKGAVISWLLWILFIVGYTSHPLLGPLQNMLSMIYLTKNVCFQAIVCMAIGHAIETIWGIWTLMTLFPQLNFYSKYASVLRHWMCYLFFYGWPVTQQIYHIWKVHKEKPSKEA
jgi:hypothetical protein